MGLATRGTNFCKPEVVRYEWELAKELGINITVHVAMDRFGYTKGQLTALRDMDLLYPNTTYIHASHLTDEEWLLVRDSRRQRLARAPDRAPDGPRLGARPEGRSSWASRSGLSSDVATTASADQFTQMHAILVVRARAAAPGVLGRGPRRQHRRRPDLITAREVLRWATIDGAKVAGHRRPHGLDHARQEGRPRDHRRPARQRRPDHRPGRGRRLRRGHLERRRPSSSTA